MDWAKEEEPELYRTITEKYLPRLKLDLEKRSIFHLIYECNNPERVKLDHELYMAVARIGKEEEYVGIDWVRWWYQRNLTIYSNIAKLANAPSDNILLIIGAAHVHLISQFLKESGLFDVHPAIDYLN